MGTEFDFDRPVCRKNTDSLKWNRYPPDVLPLWVADMDFCSPPAVVDALRRRVDHGFFGYGMPSETLRRLICRRLLERQGWEIAPDWIVFLPSLVCGLNVVCRGVGRPGGKVLVATPVYPPFLSAPGNQGKELTVLELSPVLGADGRLEYPLDLERLRRLLSEDVDLFIFCHPHNPTGRVYRRAELLELARLCRENEVILCSDEIHGDLLLDEVEFRSPACLDPALSPWVITLIAPSKTYNIPGLGCGMAIVADSNLRRRILAAARGIVPDVNVLGFAAAEAAYRDGESWLRAVLSYLRRNRDVAVDFVRKRWPEIPCTVPEATYLLWLDCRKAGIPGSPYRFFLDHARVALNDGAAFGAGGEGFVRLNFACSRSVLQTALERMDDALRRCR